MEQYTHIAFLYVMPGLMLVTWITALVWQIVRSKKQNTSIEQSFWFSWLVSILLIGVIMYLWSTKGLSTALDSYKTVHEYSVLIQNQFPIIATLILTFLGVFLSFALLRPQIKIGEYMAYANESKRLVVNVHNTSWFAANNVSAKLYACSDDNEDQLVDDIILEDSDNHKLDWCLAHNNANAMEFNTSTKDAEKVKNVLLGIKEDKKYLELRVTATHAMSGTTSTFCQRYNSETILYGYYEKNQFMVIEEDQSQRVYKRWKSILSTLYRIFAFIESIAILALFAILFLVINDESIVDSYFAAFFWITFGVFWAEIGRWWLTIPYKGKAEMGYAVVNDIE